MLQTKATSFLCRGVQLLEERWKDKNLTDVRTYRSKALATLNKKLVQGLVHGFDVQFAIKLRFALKY